MISHPLRQVLTHLRRAVRPREASESLDGDLLRRFDRQHDEAAFEELLRRHGPMVLRVGQRLLRQRQDAEDVFQATFLTLARKAGSIRKGELVGCWLHDVAQFLALRVRRTAKRQEVRETNAAERPAPDPLEEVSVREAQAMLDEELARLPQQLRAPLVLCYLEGATRDEAARRLGWSLATLKRRLESGRELLRQRLTRRGLTLSAALLGTLVGETASAALPAETAALALRFLTGGGDGRAAVLAREAIRAMSVAKVKLAAALIVAMAVLTGVGVAAYRAANPIDAAASQPPDEDRRTEDKKPIADENADNPLPRGVVARLGTMRFRHGGAIECIAYTRDGKVLATGGSDEIIRLWDAATGKLLRVLDEQQSQLRALAITSDSKLLAAASADDRAQVRVWDAATGKLLHTFKGGGNCVVFSHNDRRLLWAGPSGDVHWWDLATGQEVAHKLDKVGNGVAVTFGPGGKALLAGADKGVIKVWDLEAGKVMATLSLDVKDAQVFCAAFTPDGRGIVTGGGGFGQLKPGLFGTVGIFRLWSIDSGKLVHDFKSDEAYGGIRGLALSPDGKLLATGSDSEELRLWDTQSGKPVRKLHVLTSGFTNCHPLAFSPDGRTLASGGTSQQGVRLWSVGNGKPLFEEPESHEAALRAVAVSPDGKRIASGGEDVTLRLWDTGTGKPLWKHVAPKRKYSCWIYSVAFSPDGKQVAALADEETITLFDAATGKEQQLLKIAPSDVRGLAFAPDGKTLAAGLINRQAAAGKGGGKLPPPNRIQLWDAASGKERWDAPAPDGHFCHLGFSPDGKRLYSAHDDKKVRTLATDTGKPLAEFEITGHAHWLQAVAFSPDGRLAATNGWDGNVFVWEMSTGKQIHGFHIETGIGYRLAFSPDSRYLAAGGPNGFGGRPTAST